MKRRNRFVGIRLVAIFICLLCCFVSDSIVEAADFKTVQLNDTAGMERMVAAFNAKSPFRITGITHKGQFDNVEGRCYKLSTSNPDVYLVHRVNDAGYVTDVSLTWPTSVDVDTLMRMLEATALSAADIPSFSQKEQAIFQTALQGMVSRSNHTGLYMVESIDRTYAIYLGREKKQPYIRIQAFRTSSLS